MAKNTTSRKLYDMLVSRGFDPEESNSSGTNVIDPTEGDMVKFDYIAPSGKNYGTVVILLGDDGDMSMFFGDEKGKMMEPEDRDHWFEFLQDLKPWANWNRRDFRAYNMSQLKHHLASMRKSLAESLFESLQGNAKMSWTAPPNQSRLVIHHSQRLGENDKRYRHIDKIFIENADGERFRLPFKNLGGAKAMLEHVRHGGTPYDLRGVHITEMVTELGVLSRFRRAHHGKLFEGEAATLIEQANHYYESLRRDLKHLSSPRGYNRYFESWNPMSSSETDVMVEDLRTMFIEQTLDQRIETALPLLARLRDQRSVMQEVNDFESWTNQITEGTWKIPNTPEEYIQLNNILSQPAVVGADALDITERLYPLFGNDNMFDELYVAAMRDPNADARPIIQKYMQKLGVEIPQPNEKPAEPEQQPEQPTPPQQQPTAAEPEPMTSQAPTQEMLEFPKVTEDDITVTDPKEVGAKINPAYVSPAAKATMKPDANASAPAPSKIDVKTTPVPDVKFEDIERIKSLVSYLNN